MGGSAAVRRTQVCLCVCCRVLFNLRSKPPTFLYGRRRREDAGAQQRAAEGYWPWTRMLLAVEMRFIDRGNAVSASRCDRAVQKVRPPTIC